MALAEGRVAGFEALIRWRHPERGLVPPGDFLPAAEASGFIRRIDAWALGEACAVLGRFQAAGRGGGRDGLFVGVNISAPALTDPGFLDRLDATVRTARVRPGALKIEITETMLIAADLGRVHDGCHGLGVGVALDDFGTGYSSLSYLHRFPLDTLKLDRGFIQDAGAERGAPPILRAILRLAADLRLPVVAEGIERADQSSLLAELGAGFGQGFHFARPMPADAAEALLRAGPPLVAARPGRWPTGRGLPGQRRRTTAALAAQA
jgi:diguanylate cyclase